MLDHSATYRSFKPWHWHHRARLGLLLREVAAIEGAASIADIGCSNGYITNLLCGVSSAEVRGFDYLPELVDAARSTYPHIEFRRVDLNRTIDWKRSFDLVCCFETLEHVGDVESALANIAAAVRDGGSLIVSVPVEVGAWGIAKFIGKTVVEFPADEINVGRLEYFLALLRGKDVSRYREERYTWGTHFGFDWRNVERLIATHLSIRRAYTRFATRIIVADKL